jgi:RNA polymerase sigma-54 factor
MCIIGSHLDHVWKGNYKAISRSLKIPLKETVAAIQVIKRFNPCPGQEFDEKEVQYVEPDLYVYEFEGRFEILPNDDGLPKLRFSDFARNAALGITSVDAETKEYLDKKMQSAKWLISSIRERQNTIYRVMESILKFQREFFEKGILYLRPMVLRDVALDIEKHESTVSRVTTNKYVYTPQGTYELKFFFNSAINRAGDDAIASVSVKEKIRQIISSENSARPLSDLKIAELLEAEGINIARRTVAKYREMMNILPSSKRKQFQGGI